MKKIIALLFVILITGCTTGAAPTAEPTYTPNPTYTPYPTYTHVPSATAIPTKTVVNTPVPTIAPSKVISTNVPTTAPLALPTKTPEDVELDITIKVFNNCTLPDVVYFVGPVNRKYSVAPGETKEMRASHGTYTITSSCCGTETASLFESVWTYTLCYKE